MTIGSLLKRKQMLNAEHPKLAFVPPEASVGQVAEELTRLRIGALVVLNADNSLAGIISERDVVRALSRHGTDTLTMTAADLMTREVVSADAATSIEDASRMMNVGHFRHLPVIEDGSVAGVLSIRDVLETRVSQSEHEVDTMKKYVVRTY